MVDLSTGAEIGRLDHHSPANFLPENYSFVGCFHNRFTFGLGRFNSWDKVAEDLLAKLASNSRPHGPGVTNCDHCGAAIAFVGVFQHRDGDYIAVGNICAENRFPLSNVEFDRLRKAHRLGSATRRAEAKFDQFKVDHPEVDWTAAEASTDSRIRYALSQGRKYGSLFDYRLQLINSVLSAYAQSPVTQAVAAGATLVADEAVAAPVAPAPQSPEVAWILAYNGNSSFFNSLKQQAQARGSLSPKQAECVTREVAKQARANDPQAQAKAAANQALVPGIYIAKDGTIWKVQGNQPYKSGAKRAVAAKIPFDPSTVSGARLYAKVWTAGATRITLGEVSDLSQAQGWEYVAGAITTVDFDHKMNVDEVKHFATLYSQCVWCGKALENTASYGTKFIEQGIGPVCIKYIDATVKAPEIDPHAGHSHP